MKHVTVNPYIGPNYRTTGFLGKKILVIDESLSCGFSNTAHAVLAYLEGRADGKFQQTLLSFEQAVFGRETTAQDRADFWNSVIFYDYLQGELSEGEADAAVLEQSAIAFSELLETCQPDYVIVWGSGLYNALPELDGHHSFVMIDNFLLDVWNYHVSGRTIPAMRTHYPSSHTGLDWQYWHPFYRQFLHLPW